MDLMQLMALDLIASFMPQLVSAQKPRIEKCLKSSTLGSSAPVGGIIRHRLQSNSFCDCLAEILIKNDLCGEMRDAVTTIVPAFLSNNISLAGGTV
jgi:hypothetical protein